ncbi:MAG: GNAT family N-acetyltransferase [Candidatus Nitrosotenuis sp.]
MAKYIIREAHNDVLNIAQLRAKIKEFQPIEPEEYTLYWNSFIKDNPCSTQKALIAVNEQNRVIAHIAMVPFKFRKDEKLLLGGFICELMVDEDYRQELLFPKMLLKMLKEYKDLGVDFVYSLSNREKVVKAYQSFSFRIIGELDVYAKPYKLTKIVQYFIKNKILNAILRPCLSTIERLSFLRRRAGRTYPYLEITEIPRFDLNIDQFISNVQKHFPYCILRNSTILNWRTVDSPTRKYQILVVKEKGNIIGYIILRRMKMKQFDVLAIVDILFSPERVDVGRALLNATHKIALQLNVDMSTFLSSPHDPLFPILKKYGYFKTPDTFYLFLHEHKGSNLQFKEDTFNKWHLTWLDHDSV